jgi:hypothetical protein
LAEAIGQSYFIGPYFRDSLTRNFSLLDFNTISEAHEYFLRSKMAESDPGYVNGWFPLRQNSSDSNNKKSLSHDIILAANVSKKDEINYGGKERTPEKQDLSFQTFFMESRWKWSNVVVSKNWADSLIKLSDEVILTKMRGYGLCQILRNNLFHLVNDGYSDGLSKAFNSLSNSVIFEANEKSWEEVGEKYPELKDFPWDFILREYQEKTNFWCDSIPKKYTH